MRHIKSASNWIALLSLVVSLASFAVSYQSHKLAVSEELSLRLTAPLPNSEIYLEDGHLGTMGTIAYISYPFTISNTGNRKLSITSYQMYFETPKYGKISYTDIDKGLFHTNGLPLQLPLTLDAGESVQGFFRVGALADSTAVKLLLKGRKKLIIQRRRVDFELAKHGIDLFGNKVALKNYSGGAYSITWDDINEKSSRLLIKVVTGEDKSASASVAWTPDLFHILSIAKSDSMWTQAIGP